LTRQDRTAPKFPDLLHRDFTAPTPNAKWCGDITEIPTDEGKLFLASVPDPRSVTCSAGSAPPQRVFALFGGTRCG
jgi:putative transposase